MTTTRKIDHNQFTVERTYKHAPARVWTALTTKAGKSRWFTGPAGWTQERHDMDVRPGGRELSIGGFTRDGALTKVVFDAHFYDVVDAQRLVYAYEMYINDERLSASLATVELIAVSGGTRIVHTEMGAFLDGRDKPEYREAGTNQLLDTLGATLD